MLLTTVFPVIKTVPGTWQSLCKYLIKYKIDPTMVFYEQINTVSDFETRGFYF